MKVANYEDRKRFWRERNQRNARRVRLEVLAAYGDHCACCGEGHEVFLVIDHIAGGGNAHRAELGNGNKHNVSSTHFYYWLRREGFPSGFQVLCHNCNMARARGRCPHRTVRRAASPVMATTQFY